MEWPPGRTWLRIAGAWPQDHPAQRFAPRGVLRPVAGEHPGSRWGTVRQKEPVCEPFRGGDSSAPQVGDRNGRLQHRHTVPRDLAGRHASTDAEWTGRQRNPHAKAATSSQATRSRATIAPSWPPVHVRLSAKNPLDPPRSRHVLHCERAATAVPVDLFNIMSSLVMLRVSHSSDAFHFDLRFGVKRADGAVLTATHYSHRQIDAPTAVREKVRAVRFTRAHSRSYPGLRGDNY